MGYAANPALPFALWPLLTVAVVALWIVAMVDVAGNRRTRRHTRTELSCMAAAVSVVAVIAIAGIVGGFAGPRGEAADERGIERSGREDVQARAYIFSFGLEHASHPRTGHPAKDGNVAQER